MGYNYSVAAPYEEKNFSGIISTCKIWSTAIKTIQITKKVTSRCLSQSMSQGD